MYVRGARVSWRPEAFSFLFIKVGEIVYCFQFYLRASRQRDLQGNVIRLLQAAKDARPLRITSFP